MISGARSASCYGYTSYGYTSYGWTLVIQPSPSAEELTSSGSSFRLVLTSTTSPGHTRSWVRAAQSHGAVACCCGLCGFRASDGSVNQEEEARSPTRRLMLG